MSRLRILNTRPRGQAGELSRLLDASGFEPVEAPAIEIVPAWDAAELSTIRAQLRAGELDWVILPSQNAAAGLHDELGQARVVCGATTARSLDLVASVSLPRFSARAALEVISGLARPGERALVPRAAEGRDELLSGLRGLGIEVEAPIAYRTAPVPDAAECLGRQHIDLVTLCSPSAVRSVSDVVRARSLRVVCLGDTTAEAARQAGLCVGGVARDTSMTSLVEAVQAAISRRAVLA